MLLLLRPTTSTSKRHISQDLDTATAALSASVNNAFSRSLDQLEEFSSKSQECCQALNNKLKEIEKFFETVPKIKESSAKDGVS